MPVEPFTDQAVVRAVLQSEVFQTHSVGRAGQMALQDHPVVRGGGGPGDDHHRQPPDRALAKVLPGRFVQIAQASAT